MLRERIILTKLAGKDETAQKYTKTDLRFVNCKPHAKFNGSPENPRFNGIFFYKKSLKLYNSLRMR